MTELKRTNGIILSFILGGAIGSAIALLYAPKSGKHLRQDINRKAADLVGEGKRITSDSWKDTKEFAGNAFESVNGALKSGIHKIVSEKEKVREALNAGLHSFQEELK